MIEPHLYEVDDDDGRRVVFVCSVIGCGRKVILVRGARRYVVIDAGDFFAEHRGSVGPITVTLA